MEYQLKRRKNAKKIKIRVVEGAVIVSAPFYVSTSVIDRFVKSQQDWIQNQKDKNPILQSGDVVTLFGNTYTLTYIEQKRCYVQDNRLYLYPNKAMIQSFLKKNAKKQIDQRFHFFCEQLHIHDISLHYGFYKSKWGSCTPRKKKICFNVNLIFMPLSFVDAILLHEIAHLFYLNHGKEFYNLLCTWMPNYKQVIKECKSSPIPRLY